jgi:hypothetical protein
MKHLKTFEYFSYGAPGMGSEEEEEMNSQPEMDMFAGEEEEEMIIPPFGEDEMEGETCPSCNCRECECEDSMGSEGKEFAGGHIKKFNSEEEEEDKMMPSDMEVMKFESKKSSKKAKPDFLDLDKDGDKKESMKKAAADKKKGNNAKDEKEDKKTSKAPKGKLSKAQEKLPPALKKAIAQGVRD